MDDEDKERHEAELAFEQAFPEIPEEFHCFETGQPFETCLECRLPLIDELESQFYISKAFERGETVLELALCSDCAERFREDISKQSREQMQQFLAQGNCNDEHMLATPEEKTSCCFICACKRGDLEGFTIQAVCSGRELINMFAPLLVCHECEASAAELLSVATREHYDRFFEDNFPGPPAEDVDLPRRNPMLI